ncbi:MAG: IS66 family insertion sequence element accessory protein TnpB [Rikenellaceae bacterium]
MNDILLSTNLTARYYFYTSCVDMRKGAHSLYHMIKQSDNFSALNGDYFIFIGATRKSIKIIWWHKDGFAMYCKRLELGCFVLPTQITNSLFYELTKAQISRLIHGVRYRSVGGELRLKAILNI